MSKKTGIFLVLIAMFLAACGYFLLRPRPQPPSAEMGGTGIVLSGYDSNGTLTWRMEAKGGEVTNDEKGTFHGVTLVLYEAGKERVRASSPTLSFAHDRARLTGGVEVLADGKDRLTTNEVDWSKKEGTLSGEGKVALASANAKVKATGFTYDPRTGRGSLKGDVSAEINEPSKTTATGREAEYDPGRVVLSGNVVIETGDETYQCAQAEYTKGNGTIELSGGVQGKLPSGRLQAGRVSLRDDGITASNGVHLFLNSDFFTVQNGA